MTQQRWFTEFLLYVK